MGLQFSPHDGLQGRRRMRLDIEADIFLELLKGMDGMRRIRAHGLPQDARCVGLVVDQIFNTVSLMLESSEWPEVPPEYALSQLNVTFTEYFGDAQPQDHLKREP